MSPDTAIGVRTGAFVAVVGPSGAGKDTVIRKACERLEDDHRFHFVRRIVTRPAEPEAEDHETLGQAAFDRYEAEGRFSLSWRAHGLAYGLPASAVQKVETGAVVVANISRHSIASAIEAFPAVVAVTVTAEPDILIERIVARGREDRAAALERLSRSAPATGVNGLAGAFTIDNSGPVDAAVDRFCSILNEMLPE
ncbi:phosphonate metabolism protein/1,5-bisphosphokinase (PRPP-forming) PhnN [Fulvimarina sp. MAC3]|uniref:phosphonate metabolism protein/1,5-bisphosphokinase (PRPP-forming) PhnN n=1 Tax=Fulvimarina sp. MAC3 TaxID=3148887 RepID=UPI0031FDE742